MPARLKSLARSAVPVVITSPVGQATLAFLLVNALLLVVMRVNGTNVLDPYSYLRADSGHYLSIADRGYELFRCNPERYPPGSWCGNAAWFPAYPWLIRLLTPLTRHDATVAAVLISKAFLLGMLIVLAYTLRDFFGARSRLPMLLAAAVFPGAIYYQVAFPISQFLFFSLLHMWFLLKRKDVLAGLCGAAAAMSYSTGYALAAVSGVYLLLTFESWRTLVRRSLVVTGLTLIGVVGVLAVLQATTGSWKAWFLVQGKYGWDRGRPLWALSYMLNPWNQNAANTVTATQNIAICLMLAWVTVDLAIHRAWDEAAKLYFVYACVFFWAPVLLVGPRLGYYRTYSMLMPAVVFMARWPSGLTASCLAAFGMLFSLLSILFFNSKIV